MIDVYLGSTGKEYRCGKRIGGGGEGSIFTVEGDPSTVLKIYDNPTKAREDKLKAMVSLDLKDSGDVIWPRDIVYSYDRRFKGFAMNRIDSGTMLCDLYEYGCKTSQRKKTYVAMNLCAAVESIHAAGQVIGDFNPNNMFVDTVDCRVKLLDTDSYHICSGDNTYRCTVGMADYLAPEIANRYSDGHTLADLGLPTFTAESDRFALGVHIFRLLMNGAHPFSCALSKEAPRDMEVPTVYTGIKTGKSPYFCNSDRSFCTPIFSPDFTSLTVPLQLMFKKCFIDGYRDPAVRPNTVDWHNALSEYKDHLIGCGASPLHAFSDNNSSCPLCDVDSRFKMYLCRFKRDETEGKIRKKIEKKQFGSGEIKRYGAFSLPYSKIMMDPSFTWHGRDPVETAKDIIAELGVVDEEYLILGVCKMVGISKSDKTYVEKIRSILRQSLFHVDEGEFVTYCKDHTSYKDWQVYYRLPGNNGAHRDIVFMPFPEIRTLLLQILQHNKGKPFTDISTTCATYLRAKSGPGFAETLKKGLATMIDNGTAKLSNGLYFKG